MKHIFILIVVLFSIFISGCTSDNYILIKQNDKSTTYYPNTTYISGGTAVGTIQDMFYYNSGTYNISEGSGANPLDLYVNFTNVQNFDQLIIREYYLGSASHFIQVQIWDYEDNIWEDYFEFVGQTGFTIISVPVFDTTEHIENNVTQVRLHHVQNGISSHRLYIDFMWLVSGNTIGGSTNLDGYARYNFSYNNLYGNGSFTTSGNIYANNLYNKTETDNLILNNTPNYSNISSGMNISGELRYNTDFVGGYTFPSRTLEVIQDEISFDILPVGALYGVANSMITKSTSGTNLSDVLTQFVGTASTTGYNQEWIGTRNLRKFEMRAWESSQTSNLRETTIGCWRASVIGDMQSIYEGAFFQAETTNYTISLCNSDTGCTTFNSNYPYIYNIYNYFTITTDAPNIIDGQATNYFFYINGTFVGNISSNKPDYTAMCGIWTENRDTTLNRMSVDNVYAEFTRKY